MTFLKTLAYRVGKKLMSTAIKDNLNDKSYLESRIVNWLTSPARMEQLTGERYYFGDHDILRKERTIIGEDGQLQEVKNLPNNRKVDNQYAKMVDQKNNYLLGRPIAFDSENREYVDALRKVFNKRFHKTLKDIGEDCLNHGIAWLYPYFSDGELKFKKFAGYEVLPFWNDTAHTDLEMAVRFYLEEKPNAINEHDVIQKVEIYTKNGVDYYTFENNKLVPEVNKLHENYITVKIKEKEQGYNWNRIPLIPFKCNSKEIPLIRRCKGLQDAINDIINTFKNTMEEDTRNTIIVLENYDGQNLGEFRKNLAMYGAVKVRSGDGARGDVRTLRVEVNAANYESILKIFHKALIENCKGYDFDELRQHSRDPNQMTVKTIYADSDLDANNMETEYQCALEELLWFVNQYFENTGVGNFNDTELDIIFNRDCIVNESEIMQMLVSAGVRIPNEILLNQVPFIDDIPEAVKLLKQEEKELINAYGDALPNEGGVNNGKTKKL